MNDKHLEAVMQEFDNINDKGNEKWMPIARAKKFARTACRSYAKKVVDKLEKDNILWMKIPSKEDGITIARKAYIWCSAITELLDRLTDKEPT